MIGNSLGWFLTSQYKLADLATVHKLILGNEGILHIEAEADVRYLSLFGFRLSLIFSLRREISQGHPASSPGSSPRCPLTYLG